jgi:lipoic acid synthetase
MILGKTCTRNCAFCNISPATPGAVDPKEPERVAQAATELALKHVVITSVTRDDLPDGGAAHFAQTIEAVKKATPTSTIEVLIPDFQGDEDALNTVIKAAPNIINHNVETHPILYPQIRPQANYGQSLELLNRVAQKNIIAKSGFMTGIGENDEQIHEILGDLKKAGCRIVTIGQYLRPSTQHAPVTRYVTPEMFDTYAAWGRNLGIEYVFSAPLVRSSYQAGESLQELFKIIT